MHKRIQQKAAHWQSFTHNTEVSVFSPKFSSANKFFLEKNPTKKRKRVKIASRLPGEYFTDVFYV